MKNGHLPDFNEIWAVVLAAGKGKRMKAREKNKVTYTIKGVPMITRTLNIIKSAGINNIVVVVGFAKKSVLSLLDEKIKTIEQKKRLGTGHALKVALNTIPISAKYILVLNGDDSFLYSGDIINKLIRTHIRNESKFSLITIEVENQYGLGRILRDENRKIIGIVEEKDATESQRKIKEVNPACYLFSSDFLRKYINKIPKSNISGEYYLVSLVEMAVKNKQPVSAFTINNLSWRGVNTPEELFEAERIIVE